jgi:hypothetical protein
MVMSEGHANGEALIVPCRNLLAMFDNLRSEAEQLWAAEHRNAAPGSISVSWGSVGVRFCEELRNVPLAEAWKRHFMETSRPISPIDVHGMLNIPWPTGISDDQHPDFDLILAVATRAEERIPTPDAIADAWVRQDDGYETYFFANVRAGIRTRDDIAIWRCIEKRNPRWLATDSYADAIELLREESRF